MKTLLIALVCIFYCFNLLEAQDTLSKKRVNPHFWFKMYSTPTKIKGGLYEIKDTSIVYSTSMRKGDYYTNNFEVKQLNIHLINSIRFRNNNNILIGMLAGAFSGIVVGYIIGYSKGDDPPSQDWGVSQSAKEKALISANYGMLTGVGIGALVGSIKITIPINGNYNFFNENRIRLEKKSIRNKYLSKSGKGK